MLDPVVSFRNWSVRFEIETEISHSSKRVKGWTVVKYRKSHTFTKLCDILSNRYSLNTMGENPYEVEFKS